MDGYTLTTYHGALPHKGLGLHTGKAPGVLTAPLVEGCALDPWFAYTVRWDCSDACDWHLLIDM